MVPQDFVLYVQVNRVSDNEFYENIVFSCKFRAGTVSYVVLQRPPLQFSVNFMVICICVGTLQYE